MINCVCRHYSVFCGKLALVGIIVRINVILIMCGGVVFHDVYFCFNINATIVDATCILKSVMPLIPELLITLSQ